MLVSQPRYIAIALLIFIPAIVIFRSSLQAGFKHPKAPWNEWSKNQLLHNNASSFEHAGIIDEYSEGAPKVVQVSMQTNNNDFIITYERGLRTHLANGEKWGYPTHYLRHGISESFYFDKLIYLLTIMVGEQTKPFGKRAEWLLWFDADTILLNDEVPWSIFLPPSEGMFTDINLLVSKDWNGFNAGVFLIRVCEWSIHMLLDANGLPRLRPEVELVFPEQAAMHWVFDQPQNKKHRLYQPRHWFNVYDNYYEGMGDYVNNGSIIVHFPGMGGSRADAMGRWLDKIESDPASIRVPLENTSYPAEIEGFWSRLRAANDVLHDSQGFVDDLKNNHKGLYDEDNKKIPTNIAKAQRELRDVIEDEPYEYDKLHERVKAVETLISKGKDAVEQAKNGQRAGKKAQGG